MKSLLFLTFSFHLASAGSHSLIYFYTGVNTGIDFPEFTVVGLVDGEQFVYYDSNMRRMIPKTEWMEKSEDTRETYISERHKETFSVSVVTLMNRFNQSEGVHTVQLVYGCELHDDGTKRGFMMYGYDGEDFISLDLNTITWIAANAKAIITKLKWESHWTVKPKSYLENNCTEWLLKYVDYGRHTLERKDPPEVTLFQKDSSSPMVCHATGFFPRGVMVSWKKNGEDLHEDMELRETLPNQDGTFQKRSILTVSPEELDNNEYTCVVQHSGLEKELELRVADHRILNSELAGVIVGAGVVVFLLILSVGSFIWTPDRSEESLLTTASFSSVEYPSTG